MFESYRNFNSFRKILNYGKNFYPSCRKIWFFLKDWLFSRRNQFFFKKVNVSPTRWDTSITKMIKTSFSKQCSIIWHIWFPWKLAKCYLGAGITTWQLYLVHCFTVLNFKKFFQWPSYNIDFETVKRDIIIVD